MAELLLKLNQTERRLMEALPKDPGLLLLFNKLSNYLFYVLFPLLVLLSGPRTALYFIPAGISWEVSEFVKKGVKRERPYRVCNTRLRTSTKPDKAFPSSHSAAAFTLFLLFNPNPLAYFFLLIPLLRVLSFQHWPTDVLAGMLTGYVVYLIFTPVL